jgi:uncharacterized protein YggL (DUF469 family)
MFLKLQLFIVRHFWTATKKAKRITKVSQILLQQFQELTPKIKVAITPKGALALIEEHTHKVICLIELQEAAYSVQVVFNSESQLSPLTEKVDHIIRNLIKNERMTTEIALAYNPSFPIILMGDAAKKYLKQNNQDKSSHLSLVSSDYLN